MILLDASIIIERLRARNPALIQDLTVDGALCGVTRAEILSGSRNEADRLRLLKVLDGFQQIVTPQALWDEVGDARAVLRAGGLNVPFADTVVAVVAMDCDCELWTIDSHFPAMQRFFSQLQLRLSP